ncbi:hypothetical protein XENTR_v10011915 [Xenopus tropicalis]|nr:hypothetical protein XENTR_v10011915 [Xenopus tropicalis]
MAAAKEKERRDEVSLNAIHRETIQKENRCQKLVTEFGINPYHKVHAIARKPMSWHDNETETADDHFLKIIHHGALEPTKKYTEPQTTSQEIGWITTPLVTFHLIQFIRTPQHWTETLDALHVYYVQEYHL